MPAPDNLTCAELLEINGVVKRWAPGGPAVLDGVSLALPSATLVSIAGRNGIGKTTLLRVIAGLLEPEAGSVALLGRRIADGRTEYARRLGFLPAGNTGLYARLGVDDNLDFWARVALVPRRRRGAAIDEMLELFALHDVRGRRVDRLSMGQRQRLRLALTFLHDPALVLLDEPLTSLDAEGTAIVRSALGRLRARGGAGIVVAPDSERERLGLDRDYRLADGRLEAVG